jgi:hypothetical protein
VTCTAQNSYSAFWVGLDGDTTSTVEQLGTEADCIGGVPRYSSWYEMYPHKSSGTSVPVVAGHTYQASVASIGSNNFQLTLQDMTTKAPPFTTVQKLPNAKLASAEAIAEAPSGGGVLPLAQFAPVQFSNVTANGTLMASPPADQITMVNGSGGIKAQPSLLSGGSFTVTWQSP